MAESIDIKKIKKIAKAYHDKLTATDKRFRNCVFIIHEEGTTYFFKNAFIMTITIDADNKWIVVFSEHHGFHIFHSGDLYDYKQLKIVNDKIEELK